MTLPRLHPRQNAIAAVLGVTPPFTNPAMLAAEALRRQVFIEDTLQASGLTTLVLGISGGVDSLVAGRLAQLAVQALRTPHPRWPLPLHRCAPALRHPARRGRCPRCPGLYPRR